LIIELERGIVVRVKRSRNFFLFFMTLCFTVSSTGFELDAQYKGINISSKNFLGDPPVLDACAYNSPTGKTYYVASDGSDSNAGTDDSPWATITYALDHADDGSTILVKPGLYEGRIRVRGTFPQGVTVRSQQPYMARLRHSSAVLTLYESGQGVEGITIEGFDIAHSGSGASALVVHLEGGGNNAVSRITLRNNIIHDSYNNDLLKINHTAHKIIVEKNIFYNQAGSDEHIDINSVDEVIVQDNIFFNDFSRSGRTNNNDTSSYIVIKDSNQESDLYTGSRNVTVRRNIFLNWEGSAGNGFFLIGEDGHPIAEAFDILFENNLLLGNSANTMRSPFGVKGGRDIIFRHNTVLGDMPGNAFAMRLNVEGANPNVDNVFFYNNIWADPTGTMVDFSDTVPSHVDDFVIDNNLYWNNGSAIPNSASDEVNPDDDQNQIVADPLLPNPSSLIPPHWNSNTQSFADGSSSSCEAFKKLVSLYGTPGDGSAVIDAANPGNAAQEDILGNSRGGVPDIGAVEKQ